jgi:predicted nucleotidyltransferase
MLFNNLREKQREDERLNKIYTIDELKEIIVPIAEKHGLKRVWIFGSYARGEAAAESDVDILVEKGESNFGNALLSFDDAINKELDIIELESVNTPVFKKNITEDAILIYGNEK